MEQHELMAADATARAIATEAAAIIRGAVGRTLTARTKRHAADWVTEADEQVERAVRARLRAAFPRHRVVGEEHGTSAAAAPTADSPTWYIDPVDGTANFVHRLPWFSFSLGLVVAGEPVLGVIADPLRGELFTARRGGGAFLNGNPIHAIGSAKLAGHVVMTELAGQDAWTGLGQLVTWLAEQQCILRVMGSSALALAHVAAGRAAAAVLQRYSPWDVAAGTALCRESGATVRDGHGAEAGLPLEGLVAGHPDAATRLWSVITSGTSA